LVAPLHEQPTGARISQRGQREVTKLLLDQLDLGDVILAGAGCEREKLLRLLKALQLCQQHTFRRCGSLGDRLVVARLELRCARLAL
jgi:hypothetical protein